MKVKDLIADLQKLDPNLDIWYNSSQAGECMPVQSNPFRISGVIQRTGSYYTHSYYNPSTTGSYTYYEEDANGATVLIIDGE